jgi:hypothetical protein
MNLLYPASSPCQFGTTKTRNWHRLLRLTAEGTVHGAISFKVLPLDRVLIGKRSSGRSYLFRLSSFDPFKKLIECAKPSRYKLMYHSSRQSFKFGYSFRRLTAVHYGTPQIV